MSLEALLSRMNELNKTNKIELLVATSMLASTADRIFTQGKDSNNSQIGTYSKEYLKQRRRDNYPNSAKVILQATRQMANDWSIVNSVQDIGLGFKNQENADKSGWVEGTYNKPIFDHTKDELKLVNELFTKAANKAING